MVLHTEMENGLSMVVWKCKTTSSPAGGTASRSAGGVAAADLVQGLHAGAAAGQRVLLRSVLALVVTATVTSALAQLPEAPERAPQMQNTEALLPYEATYKTSTRGLNLTLERRLSIDDNGDCRLTSDGKLLVAGISEVSVFTVNGDQVEPKSYIYQLSGPVNRRREVHFEQGSDTIRSLYKKKWYDLPNEPGTLDRMSQQEQLRLLLLNDDTPRDNILFRVADGRKVKEYLLRYDGEEVIDTPMGAVNTLRFERDHDDPERRSAFWVAPAWDYLMVRTVHVEDGRTTEANLVSASIDGRALRGNAAG
jgi:hypothetical protein